MLSLIRYRSLACLTLVSAGSLIPSVAHADNLFITTDTAVSGFVTDRNYIVGKDDAINFQTLPGSITLDVTGDIYPDTTNVLFGPYVNMFGVNVFGSHKSNISGSTQGLNGYDNSVNTLSGFAQNYGGYDNASLTINGGTSNDTRAFHNSVTTLNTGQIILWRSFQNARLIVNGGTVSNATLNNSSVATIAGGTVTNLTVNTGATAHIVGGAVANILGSGSVDFNVPVILQLPPIHLSGNTQTTITNTSFEKITVDSSAEVTIINSLDTLPIDSVVASEDSLVRVVTAEMVAMALAQQAVATLTGVFVGGQVFTGTGPAMARDNPDLLTSGGTVNYFSGNIADAGAGADPTSGGTVNYFSGYIAEGAAGTGGTFNVYGGTFGATAGLSGRSGISLYDNGVFNFYGNNLTISSAMPGSDANGSFNAYFLNGTLANGDVLDNVKVYDYDGGLSVGNPNLGLANTGNIRFLAPVPEPGSFALLGIAALPIVGLIRRRANR